jgi:hypothetical protein
VRVLVDDAVRSGDARILLAVIDQAFGRPTERVERTAAGSDPLDLESLSLDQIRLLRSRVLEDHPERAEVVESWRTRSEPTASPPLAVVP